MARSWCNPFDPLPTGSVSTSPQDLMQEVGELLEIPGDLKILTPSEQHCVATNLLIGLEDILRVLSKFLPNGPLTVHAPAGTGKSDADS